MSDKVILNYNGNELELPVTTGTMDEKSIDISKLRSATGLITMDPGYKNTGLLMLDELLRIHKILDC